MIQFNLLPDIKLEYIRATRTKRMVVLASAAIAGVFLFIFVLLFVVVNVVQKQHISNLNKDIEQNIAQLREVPDLDKVLTVQNQLGALPSLHDQKPVSVRLYNYLIQLTPTKASISEVKIDFASNVMTISGSADSLVTVNKFVDTIKFTEYEVDNTKEKAFKDVVLTSFSVASSGSDEKVTYQIDFSFEPVIFDSSKNGKLIVPNIISTRSVTEKPSDLFEQIPENQRSE